MDLKFLSQSIPESGSHRVPACLPLSACYPRPFAPSDRFTAESELVYFQEGKLKPSNALRRSGQVLAGFSVIYLYCPYLSAYLFVPVREGDSDGGAVVGRGSADDGAARWLHHNTNNIISHRMSAGAIDVDDMRAKFEGRFMEKGGVSFDSDRCFFVWKGLPCTDKCSCSRRTACGSPDRFIEYDWWAGRQTGCYRPPHRCTPQVRSSRALLSSCSPR